MTTATISVVIAARDMARYIGETLASLQMQSLEAFEAVVVDDHSRDGTSDIVAAAAREDPRIRIVPATARGVSNARNQGFAQASAPNVLFLDADDVLVPDALARLHATLSDDGGVAALGGIVRIDEDGAPLPHRDNRALVREGDQLEGLLKKNYIVNGGALLIRRSAIEEVGGYDPALAYGEDWEFWCRLCESGRLAVVPGDPVLKYRQVGSGANNRARLDYFAASIPCLEKIAARSSLVERYGRRLSRFLRARRIDIFWANVRSEYQFGRKSRALSYAIRGLFCYPDSLLRPRLALRLLRSLALG